MYVTFLFFSVYLGCSKWIARVGIFINRAVALKSKFYDDLSGSAYGG